MTRQKIYAILRKDGHKAAKWEASPAVRGWGEYSTGPRVYARTGDTIAVTYECGHSRGALECESNAMHNYIVPALEAAGVKGEWVDERTWQVSA